MSYSATGSTFSGGQFNTLAQSGAKQINKIKNKRPIIVNGSGALLNNKANSNKAKKKIITQELMQKLAEVATNKGRPKEHIQYYWNTWHCQERIYGSEGRVFGKYCKNRFCTVCSGNRKAEIINKYLPVIKTWENPQFVTLTVKSVHAKELNNRMNEMKLAFRKIKNKFRKWHVKGKSIKLMGVKTLECNFNPIQKWYNPHFHIIVPNKATANILVQEWRKHWGYKIAYCGGQNIREIDNPEICLVEVVKYFSKIFTDPEMKKKSEKKVSPIIYVSAIDNIIWAMKPYRIFERFGFNLPKTNTPKESKATVLVQYDEWVYSRKQNDWANAEDSEQLLTGYTITSELIELLENNIDTDLE